MERRIIDTTDDKYIALQKSMPNGRYNGAYYYSREIVKNIIPYVRTYRNWDTLGMRAVGSESNSIVFIHHNVDPGKNYAWLRRHRNVVIVVSNKAVYKWAKVVGHKVIFLPLSVDVEYVKQFKTPKTKNACYAGNRWKFKAEDIEKYVPDGTDFPPKNIEREELLKFMAPYRKCYAIGRCAIEARVLGCEVLKCDHRYEPEDFPILDNRDAAKILQEELDKVDGIRV